MPAFAKSHTPHTLHEHPRKCMDIHVRPLRASPTHNAFQHKMAPCRGVPRAEPAGARRACHACATISRHVVAGLVLTKVVAAKHTGVGPGSLAATARGRHGGCTPGVIGA